MTWKPGQDLAQMFHLLIDGIDAIAAITETTKDDDAVAALKAIGAAIGHVKAGVEGKASPEAVQHAIADLRSRLAGNDAAVDAALKSRFPPAP